eukprot:TRINITY_DN980_c0_g1_i2.p1 TRINITY_DN980_c0_g1~~TRINITY_DN980_c0_g1_i2.p1  ORF type:complete len:185 (-),score=23.59 TRINITY_DN980_c0_g1_i2:267-821(-)
MTITAPLRQRLLLLPFFVRYAEYAAEVDSFDLCVAINGPLMYVTKMHDRVDGLLRIYRALRPGGVVLIDIPNFSFLLMHMKDPPPSREFIGQIAVTRTQQRSIDIHRSLWMHTDTFSWTDPSSHETKSTQEIHAFAIITVEEVRFLLENAGFVDIRTYNSWNTRTVESIRGERIIIAGQKPWRA